jgi:hypothetical protein
LSNAQLVTLGKGGSRGLELRDRKLASSPNRAHAWRRSEPADRAKSEADDSDR